MRIASWNINSLSIRLPQLLDWLALHAPDALVLQEIKLTDDKFPHAELNAAGYVAECFGQKTYNGVALISKLPALDVVKNIPGHDDEQARVIAGTIGDVRVIGAYVVNGQAVDSPKFVYKMGWLDALRDYLRAELVKYPKLVIMGDFNIAPDDRDVHDPALWAGQVLCSPQEREHFAHLLALGLHDSFRLFEQPPKIYSWWDYRQLAFRRNQGLRIDHILVSDALKGAVKSSIVDKLTRKNERPSDHAPVIAELDL
jgi:exodeoxyribonuclease-3